MQGGMLPATAEALKKTVGAVNDGEVELSGTCFGRHFRLESVPRATRNGGGR